MGRRARLVELVGKINEQHGRSTVGIGAALRPADIPRVSAGSLSFDFALGGGVPLGKVMLLYGDPSSGKTTSAYRIMGNAQKLCANCLRPAKDYEVVKVKDEVLDPSTGEVLEEEVHKARGTCDCFQVGILKPKKYSDEKSSDFNDRVAGYKENSYEEFVVMLVDAEGAFNHGWGQCVGLDSRVMLYVCPDTAEEIVDVYDSMLRTGSVDMVCLDSIAAMTPSAEVDDSAEQDHMGEAARIMNRFCRKIGATANAIFADYGRLITQVWINQPRVNIGGGMFAKKTTLPGGKQQLFASSVTVKMWANKWEIDNQIDGKEENKMSVGRSVRMNFLVEKNKTAPAKINGGYKMCIVGEDKGSVDELGFMVDVAQKYGAIEKFKTSWILGEEKFLTKKAMLEKLGDPVVKDRLRRSLLVKMLGEM